MLKSSRDQDTKSFAKYNLPFNWELVLELVDTTSYLVECHCKLGIAAARSRLRQQGANKASIKGCFLLIESMRFGFRVQTFLNGRPMSDSAIQAYRACYEIIIAHSQVEHTKHVENEANNQ